MHHILELVSIRTVTWIYPLLYSGSATIFDALYRLHIGNVPLESSINNLQSGILRLAEVFSRNVFPPPSFLSVTPLTEFRK